jgi:hypothetical protein
MVLMGYSPDFRLRTEASPLQEEVLAAKARIEKLKTLRSQLKEH